MEIEDQFSSILWASGVGDYVTKDILCHVLQFFMGHHDILFIAIWRTCSWTIASITWRSNQCS